MKILNKYFKLQKEIYDYFDYQEDWVKIPIDDATDCYWKIQGTETRGSVIFAKEKKYLINGSGDTYSNEIYTQRFLKKWVYRAEDYTMICVDTHCDGNKFLQIFDNSKEVKNED
jgi:hypothetical protein